jgi:hypothetical protein
MLGRVWGIRRMLGLGRMLWLRYSTIQGLRRALRFMRRARAADLHQGVHDPVSGRRRDTKPDGDIFPPCGRRWHPEHTPRAASKIKEPLS